MILGHLQTQLEAIYDLERTEVVDGFVVGPEAAARLGGTGQSEEELLVAEEDGELQIALYLDPGLLTRMQAYGPAHHEALEGDLNGYCQVAEGVSHFLYLLHTALSGRQVSLLELETQAEVDKFALCVLTRWNDATAASARALHQRLFRDVRFREGLSGDERRRYEEANRISANYCKGLLEDVAERRLERLLSRLRYSYRLGAEAKLSHLAKAP